jgi:RNA polymerase sigma-70 factor, ECF subfamily
MSTEVSDGDLVRLAREGDPVAFRLLVERHQPMVRARARQLGPDLGDVDDIMQESFLQAFLALDRLRDPDRFAGWLTGIVSNVGRSLYHRRAPVTLLADWPEPLHPVSAVGLPSAEELDRAEAIGAAVSSLPEGQRRSVTLHYYADVPAGQVADTPGAARASLHKARLRLRAYLTEHRPDLVPTGRTAMTTVRLARITRRIPPGPIPDRFPTHVMVLADEAGRRELPIWLLGQDSHRFADDAQTEPAADELTGRLLDAAGARVTSVDIGELGPEVTVARIELATPGGPAQVAARLADGLAMAITTGAPIRVADTVLDRMAVAAGTSQDGPVPEQTADDLRRDVRPEHQEHNLTFADGLEHWVLGGSFTENAVQSHWQDYAATGHDGTAVLAAAVPQPAGFAWLAQEIFADDCRGAAVTFRGQFRASDVTGLAGLFVRTMEPRDVRGTFTAAEALADPKNHVVTVASDADWTRHEVTAPIPAGASTFIFGVFLAGPGRVELRSAELTRAG